MEFQRYWVVKESRQLVRHVFAEILLPLSLYVFRKKEIRILDIRKKGFGIIYSGEGIRINTLGRRDSYKFIWEKGFFKRRIVRSVVFGHPYP